MQSKMHFYQLTVYNECNFTQILSILLSYFTGQLSSHPLLGCDGKGIQPAKISHQQSPKVSTLGKLWRTWSESTVVVVVVTVTGAAASGQWGPFSV